MDEIQELGTDINSNWEFKDGDLKLVKNDKNIAQSITSRLNTYLGEMDGFYSAYGSCLMSFLGWRANDETLEFMRIEIINALAQDPRLQDVDVVLMYVGEGVVNGEITIYYSETGSDLSLSFVLDETGVEVTSEDDSDGVE